MSEIENLTAKELYDNTKSKLYGSLSDNDKQQVWTTSSVWIRVRGVDIEIKADRSGSSYTVFPCFDSKDWTIDLNIEKEFRSVPSLVKYIDKELVSFAKNILNESA